MLLKEMGRKIVDRIHLTQEEGRMPGSCGHGNEMSDSIKGSEFLDYLIDSQLLKKISASWNLLTSFIPCWLIVYPKIFHLDFVISVT